MAGGCHFVIKALYFDVFALNSSSNSNPASSFGVGILDKSLQHLLAFYLRVVRVANGLNHNLQ